ncbi:MAG TPA: hypothetical protein VIE89_08830 [Candidatus Binatia bacterium]
MKSSRQGLAVDFYSLFGYLSGLLFIKPEMDPVTLIRTATLVHILDAILCRVIAGHSGRQKFAWTVAGLFFGIWALGTLFLLPARKPKYN